MKMNRFYLWLPLLLLSFGSGNVLATNNVRIEFVHPERFSDFRIQGWTETESAGIFRNKISNFLSPTVAQRFPGATLTLKFTDIDLAGRYRWGSVRRFNNVRFARDFQSPIRLFFDYTLTDPKGRILASGSTGVTNNEYLYHYNYYPLNQRTDTLFYESVTLDRWVSALTPTNRSVAGK